MEPTFRQKLHRGYADSTARGLEIAGVPVVFGGLGWLIDRLAGTSPLFTLALATFAMIGTFVKLWLGYDAAMKKEEEGAIWNRGTSASRDRAGGAA